MNSEHPRREVRLRHRFAELYPTIPAGAWLPAAQWVDAIVTRAAEARRLNLHRRTFDPRHFEFRDSAPLAPGNGQRPEELRDGLRVSAPAREPGGPAWRPTASSCRASRRATLVRLDGETSARRA
jgi:hypothetical protein